MAKLHVALVRHGHYHQAPGVPSAHLPHALTSRGEAQALDLASTLRSFAAQHELALHAPFHASSLLRAFQTATIASAACFGESRVLQDSRLAERSLGSAANLDVATIEAIVARDPRGFDLPSGWKSSREVVLPLPGAESLAQAGARVAAYIQQICASLAHRQQGPELVVFVGHGGALRHAAVEFGLLTKAQAVAWSMHHAKPVFLVRHDWQNWEQVGGEWKERDNSERND